MKKHPQNNLFQLAIVRSAGQKLRPLPVGPRWWGPPSPRRIAMPAEGLPIGAELASPAHPCSAYAGNHANLLFMSHAALPALRRYDLSVVVRRLRKWLHHTVAGNTLSGVSVPSAVLAFRRPKRLLLAQPDTDSYLGRKMPGRSVACGVSHQSASKEGGRK